MVEWEQHTIRFVLKGQREDVASLGLPTNGCPLGSHRNLLKALGKGKNSLTAELLQARGRIEDELTARWRRNMFRSLRAALRARQYDLEWEDFKDNYHRAMTLKERCGRKVHRPLDREATRRIQRRYGCAPDIHCDVFLRLLIIARAGFWACWSTRKRRGMGRRRRRRRATRKKMKRRRMSESRTKMSQNGF